MPVTIPPFVQYQQQLIPLRGVWNRTPPEGDRFTSIEIDWALTTLGGTDNSPRQAVQIDVGGNSPVAFSQIAALVVDNNRCAADVTVLFPDSGFELAVPAYAGGVFPVLTNALTFYVISPQAKLGDVTTLQVCNTVPPPVALLQSQAQAVVTVVEAAIVQGTVVTLLPATVNGVIEAISLNVFMAGQATAQNLTGFLTNAAGTETYWGREFAGITNNPAAPSVDLSGLKLRFSGGLAFRVSFFSGTGNAFLAANIYYSVP